MTEPIHEPTLSQSNAGVDDLAISPDISFQSAIEITHQLLHRLEQANGDAIHLEHTLVDLVSSKNGARGFFVTYLTGDSPLADHPPRSIIRALQSAPGVVADLLVKNLAMSSSMAIAHRRQGNHEQAAGSERVQARTLQLIQMLQMPEVTVLVDDMRSTLAGESDAYAEFLQRWNYDDEQKQAIRSAFQPL